MEDKLKSQLAANPVFAGVAPGDLQTMLPCMDATVRSYRTGEAVYRQGQQVRALGIVLAGTLQISRYTDDGREIAVTTLGKNELFGEVIVFSTVGIIPNQVTAKEPTQVVFLSGTFFEGGCSGSCECLAAHRRIVRNMLGILSDKAIMLNQKIRYLTAADLRTKIAMLLCELHEKTGSLTFQLPMNREELASFFAVARPSLSRELVKMKEEGIVDFYRSSVKILNLARLQQQILG